MPWTHLARNAASTNASSINAHLPGFSSICDLCHRDRQVKVQVIPVYVFDLKKRSGFLFGLCITTNFRHIFRCN
ncbi:hypothetical protein EXN66_Car005737 [Channa argus]|uniref:Uncharacterized protein n=1 Tax=Channa argus TaxID=215402 RepID=A0A6G1PIG3_CHAAH|nr:hypothetical protein EXN66_Car005737 [Channa argus]